MTRAQTVLRWIAVVPGAILGVIAAMFPIHWVVMLQYIDNPDYDASDLESLLSPQTLESLANAFFTPFVFITVGSWIAPRSRFATGVALVALLSVLYIFGATVVFGQIQQGLYTPSRWLRLGITVLLAISGIAVGLIRVRKAEASLVTQ